MAKIRDEDVELLRERADIVEVVAGYSHLKKAGGRAYKGLCPFHPEKTPSFTVDQAKGLWHCFGCGEGGDIYNFVQKAENLPFPEAVEWLARKSGFALHYEEMRPGEKKAAGLRARIIEANETAAEFFHHVLVESKEAVDARRYLAGRGFGPQVADHWRLGYAPGRDKLCKHLLQRGYSYDEIVAADLGRKSERDGALYDTFRERVIFPTWSLQGDAIGFGARALGDRQPKYLNTSETPAFHKSRVMYGLDRAKSSIARGAALVVEGYTDVIALHEAGITEAVATNGVALGESHLELLKKFSDRAVLMFDADRAGSGAAERGFDFHRRVGIEVLVAPLPEGKDPADEIQVSGADGLRAIIAGAKPLVEFKLEKMVSESVLDTPEARIRAVRAAADVLRSHPDPIARHEYSFRAARLLGVEQESVQRAIAEARPLGQEESASRLDRDRRLPGHVKVEREALQLMLTRPAEVAPWMREIGETDFSAPVRRELFARLRDSMVDNDGGNDMDGLSPGARSLYAELAVGAEAGGPVYDTEHIDEVFVRLKVFSLERQIKAGRAVLQGVNPLNEPDRHDDLFTELVSLEAGRRDLLRRLRGAA
ncbi:DNA primase [soil metagenome]